MFAQQVPTHPEMDRLLLGLEADAFKDRERAERILMRHLDESDGPEWLYLHRLDFSNLPETRHRVNRILKGFNSGSEKVQLLDATGDPIPGAYCEISSTIAGQKRFLQHGTMMMGRTITGEDGIFAVDLAGGPSGAHPGTTVQVKVYCPEYGMAGALLHVKGSRTDDPHPLRVPLVREDRPESRRSARGRIVDKDGKGIAGVGVEARLEREAHGSIRKLAVPAMAITAKDGSFRFYPVTLEPKKEQTIIPATMGFLLTVRSHDVFGESTRINNTQVEVEHVLPRARFHRFEFEGDMKDASTVTVNYYRPHFGDTISLPERYWTNGGWLVPGRYEAEVDGKKYHRLKVTAASEEILRFEQFVAPVLRGQVLDGVTGEAIQGETALVVAIDGHSSKRLVDISDKEWRMLLAEAPEAMSRHPVHKKLGQVVRLRAVGKTDEQGRFALRSDSSDISKVVAVMPGRLPALQPVVRDEVDDRRARSQTIPNLYVFPAARLQLEVQAPINSLEGHGNILLARFTVEPDQEIDWLERLLACRRQTRLGGVALIGQTNTFLVPAQVACTASFICPKDRWSPIVFEQPFQLGPGEVKVLDRQPLAEQVPLTVVMEDPDGKPLSGLALLKKDSRMEEWHGMNNRSDEKGEAVVRLPPNVMYEIAMYDRRMPKEMRDSLKIHVKAEGGNKRVTMRFTHAHMKYFRKAH